MAICVAMFRSDGYEHRIENDLYGARSEAVDSFKKVIEFYYVKCNHL